MSVKLKVLQSYTVWFILINPFKKRFEFHILFQPIRKMKLKIKQEDNLIDEWKCRNLHYKTGKAHNALYSMDQAYTILNISKTTFGCA